MFQFFVRDDVFHDGRDECGTPIERLCYYVVCEAPNGRRWAHNTTFISAPRSAEYLLGRIETAYATGHAIDFDHWTEIDPAYGSDAYQGLDAEFFFRNREIEEAHNAGEISAIEAARLMML